MESNEEEALRQRQLVFIGKVLAEYTHGSRNYLGIIRESAGWLEDLLAEAGQGREVDTEQFVEILATIERQIKILSQTTEHLSRFAQRMGIGQATFNPQEIVEEAVSFFTRFVRRHEASLRSEVAETLPKLYSDPIQLHLLLLILLTDTLERVGKDGQIILRARSVGQQEVLIEVEGHSTSGASPPLPKAREQSWSTAQEIVADLEGRLQRTDTKTDRARTSIFLTVKQAPKADAT